MPKYRALCLFQGKGRPTIKLVDAATPEAAAAALTVEGWLVGKIEEFTAPKSPPTPPTPPAQPVPPQPPASVHWEAISTPQPSGSSWLADFFAFRVMIVPGLVRIGFLLGTIGAVVLTVVIVGFAVASLTGTLRSPRLSLFELITSLVTIWGAWLGWRIVAEFLLVVFKINDRAAEVARNTAPNTPARPRTCPACNYDLRGLETAICPECGSPV
jgi:hypothetical protein